MGNFSYHQRGGCERKDVGIELIPARHDTTRHDMVVMKNVLSKKDKPGKRKETMITGTNYTCFLNSIALYNGMFLLPDSCDTMDRKYGFLSESIPT